MYTYYIYVFLDCFKPGIYEYGDIKFEYEPFYIGKGIGDRIIVSKCDKGTFKSQKIKSIKSKGGNIISKKLFENLSFDESNSIEKDLIKKIGRRDMDLGPLTNLTDGGDGRLNGKNSPESIKKGVISRNQTIQKIGVING